MSIENIKYYTLLSSIYIPLFWAVVLLFYKLKKNSGNKFLVLLFVNISFVYFMTFNRYYENFDIYTKLFPIQAFAVLNSFPLFYLYFLYITKPAKRSVKQLLYHFILPLSFGLAFFVLMYGFMTSYERYLFISEQVYTQEIDTLKFNFGYLLYRGGKLIYIAQSAFYLILIIKQYKVHIKNISEIFSNKEGVDLIWLRYVGIGFVIVFIFNLIMHGLKLNYISTHNLLVAISYSVFSLFFMLLGVLAVRQKEIYDLNAIKYEEQSVSATSDNVSKENIINYLEQKRPYLNPDFNIYDLCSKFNTNRTYISNIINKEFKQNFRTLINSYRIKDAKKIIKESKHKQANTFLEDISKNVGFNSYATFLRVFKQCEKISPSKFREQVELQQKEG